MLPHGHCRPRAGPVSAAEYGLEVGSDEDVQRPAAGACGSLDVVHVYAVDIRALFAINLYWYKVVVEQLGNLIVLKRLALHDMTPMAGSVAYADENQAVGLFGQVDSLWSPQLPCDGVVHMAADVGATALIQAVAQPQAMTRRGRVTRGAVGVHSQDQCAEMAALRRKGVWAGHGSSSSSSRRSRGGHGGYRRPGRATGCSKIELDKRHRAAGKRSAARYGGAWFGETMAVINEHVRLRCRLAFATCPAPANDVISATPTGPTGCPRLASF